MKKDTNLFQEKEYLRYALDIALEMMSDYELEQWQQAIDQWEEK